MMFNRKAMIDAIDSSLDEHRKAYDVRVAKQTLDEHESKSEWVRKYKSQWLDACSKIAEKLEDGEPVYEDDLPRDRPYAGPAVYRAQRQGTKPYQQPKNLLALRELLELSTDEKISTSGLKDLGFGQQAMGEIIHLLKSAAVKPNAEQQRAS